MRQSGKAQRFSSANAGLVIWKSLMLKPSTLSLAPDLSLWLVILSSTPRPHHVNSLLPVGILNHELRLFMKYLFLLFSVAILPVTADNLHLLYHNLALLASWHHISKMMMMMISQSKHCMLWVNKKSQKSLSQLVFVGSISQWHETTGENCTNCLDCLTVIFPYYNQNLTTVNDKSLPVASLHILKCYLGWRQQHFAGFFQGSSSSSHVIFCLRVFQILNIIKKINPLNIYTNIFPCKNPQGLRRDPFTMYLMLIFWTARGSRVRIHWEK